MKKFILPTIVTVVVLLAVFFYDRPVFTYHKISGATQGTTYNITYEYDSEKELQPEIEKLLHKFDMTLSTYEPASIISKINRNEANVQVDEYFIEVFKEAQRVNELTEGAFDITVAPVVNALGFGSGPASDVDTALIDSLIQYVGMNLVELDGYTVIKQSPNVQLDVNAIAQGYSVDVIVAFLEDKEVENYLVEIGGELRCKGLNPKAEQWKVGIDRPFEGNVTPGANMQAVVAVSNKSLATSGNYRKFYEKDGVKYAHSIDPKTGYPVLSRLLSATVITEKCMTADAFATAFMVMGLEKSIAFLESQNELEAYLIFSDEEGKMRTYATDGMQKIILDEVK